MPRYEFTPSKLYKSESSSRQPYISAAQYKTLAEFLKTNPEYKTAYKVLTAVLQFCHGDDGRIFSVRKVERELSLRPLAIPKVKKEISSSSWDTSSSW